MSEVKIHIQAPLVTGSEEKYIAALIADPAAFINRAFSQKCMRWLSEQYTVNPVFLTNTCTAAMEIVCLAENLGPGDEVIMPSFTYVSTANAFVRHGVSPVFMDIAPGDLNIAPEQIEQAIGPRTRAVVVVHYAGVACNMDAISAICKKHNLLLIEDAAHGFGSKYKERMLGTLGDYGAISFDHTKNIHCGQGGLLIVNKREKLDAINFAYENGTNKSSFVSGSVPYFEWVSKGSKYILSELNAAFLLGQLENSARHNQHRKKLWERYYNLLEKLQSKYFQLPQIPSYADHNAHIFYIKMNRAGDRTSLRQWLLQRGIETSFHFIPLHTSAFGKKTGRFIGEDKNTTEASTSLLRLPLHHRLTEADVDYVVQCVSGFNPEGKPFRSQA